MKFSLLALLVGAVFVFPADASDVVSLTKDNFDSFLAEHPLTLAEFFAPWCGHCKALAPEYELAATALAESHKDIALAKIDCTSENDLCNDQGVQGFPTLKVFRGPDSAAPYNGQRKADAIVSYMVKQALPAVSTVTADSLEDFKASDDVVIVGYFSDKASNQTFARVADTLRDSFLFGATSDEKLAKEAGVFGGPAVVMYKKFDDDKIVYEGPFDAGDIITFAKIESMPLVGEVAPATYSAYMESGIPLAYLFADNDDDKIKFTEILLPLARKFRGNVNIATIDAKIYGQHAENVNLKQEWPAFAIQEIETSYKYAYDQAKELTEAGLIEFLTAFDAGELSPTIKSQPTPESQDGPVWIVTANTFKDIVYDDAKDVLVEFYATWCGHCKKLAPTYEELGEIFWNDEELKSKVSIAKIDTPNNDVPDEVRGFPTIKLYPAGDKENAIEYEGDRTLQSLSDFIRDNGKYGIDGIEFYKAKTAAAEAAIEKEEPVAAGEAEADHDEL
ncbi:thioredoxin-like domain-containing protein [Limtongia smithiae]|uniref:thioredoxin-like domain-containing protein n=1 Tax=Limtongia smithiae TaxID=1125753 RepID=UPI0034CE28E7